MEFEQQWAAEQAAHKAADKKSTTAELAPVSLQHSINILCLLSRAIPMSTSTQTSSGYFLIADISGYTKFLHGTELEHATAIVQELLEAIVANVRTPFRLSKIEGDAVFYHAPSFALPEGDRLLDHIEACYEEFHAVLESMRYHTDCPCTACRSIADLELKFVCHYGEYVMQVYSAGHVELSGTDVILVHRLLKNNVFEVTGLRGYALLSDACLAMCGRPMSLIPHREVYEHTGEVTTGVYDLEGMLRSRRAARTVYLREEDADCSRDGVLRATPEVLWSYCIDADRRLSWQGSTYSVDNRRNAVGRFEVGAEAHCAHGNYFRVSRFVDYRPFHYYTMHCVHRPFWACPPLHVQFEMTPIDAEHTRLSFRIRTTRRDPITVWLTRKLAPKLIAVEIDLTRLSQVLESEDGNRVSTEAVGKVG